MGDVAEPPPVHLQRLRALAPGEHALYARLFLATGGAPNVLLSGGQAAELLQKSRLPHELLRRIWECADEYKRGALDLEGFCVACRLCAHAQQAPDAAMAEQVLEGAKVSEIPAAPPWFEGFEEGVTASFPPAAPALPQAPLPTHSIGSTGSFDFEAAAFGAGANAGAAAVSLRAAGDHGMGSMPMLPVPTADQWLGNSATGPGGRWDAVPTRSAVALPSLSRSDKHGRSDADEGIASDGPSSATVLAKGLSLQPSQKESERHARRDPYQRLGEELVEGRQKLERCFGDQIRREKQVEAARSKMEEFRGDRLKTVSELAHSQCDVQHLFSELDFVRQQIEHVEREIANMRTIRQAFGPDEVTRAERTRKRIDGERVALGEDKTEARATMQVAQDVLEQDRKHITELTELSKRTGRRKLELQARQQVLLEEQRQAEQDRGAVLYAIEIERVKLHTIRSERLDIGTDMRNILPEARNLARDSQVEPSVFARCFLPHRAKAEELRGPVDPLAVPSTGAPRSAWGPAAEHMRQAGEDAASWAKAMYRHEKPSSAPNFESGGVGFSISGSSPELAPNWAHFGAARGHRSLGVRAEPDQNGRQNPFGTS